MPFIKKRNATPSAVPRPAGDYARKAIDIAADDVPERMTRQRVERKQNDVREQHQRTYPDAEMFTRRRGKPKSSDRVVPEYDQENDRNVQKITMQIL